MKLITVIIIISYTCLHMLHAQSEAVSKIVSINVENRNTKAVDHKPPTIDILSSELDFNKVNTVNKKEILIRGIASDSSGIENVLINGLPIDINEEGVFNHRLLLSPGRNLVVVSASDIYDNSTVQRYYLFQESEEATNSAINQFGDYYALIIGIEQYEDPNIIDLDNPVRDAERLKNTLFTSYSFSPENVRTLINATKSEIIGELVNLKRSLTPLSNLVIFYAGHGIWDEDMQVGYWLPSDAYLNNPVNWFSNSELRDYIRAMDSDHVLLISDACFSGSIFKVREVSTEPPPSINQLYQLNSRKAMTSGTMSVVPDRSVFIEYLINRLQENEQQFLTSEEIYSSIRMAVINNSPNHQVPQYGAIHDSGDEGGDFIFIRR